MCCVFAFFFYKIISILLTTWVHTHTLPGIIIKNSIYVCVSLEIEIPMKWFQMDTWLWNCVFSHCQHQCMKFNLTFDGIFVSTSDLLLNLASSFSCVSHLLRFNRFQSITLTILRNDSPIAQNLWQADLKRITLYIYQIDTSNLTLKSKVSPIRSQKFLPNRLPSDS